MHLVTRLSLTTSDKRHSVNFWYCPDKAPHLKILLYHVNDTYITAIFRYFDTAATWYVQPTSYGHLSR